ncbi:hypothetical protein FHC49_06995 [Kluyvera sp. EC_51]|uniref:lipopolysaccharide biosynthesis protein n=1 Tax=Kluyvera sp. EC_51 TaxID=2584089 RepID=UPI001C706D0F|nr:hypothetical protein [Kluyvera sp. EC_51]MBW9461109.1 hypothetical protein [Kluyvera sp. EC_51]
MELNKSNILNKYLKQSGSFLTRIVVSVISLLLSVIIVRVYDKNAVSSFFLFVSYTTFLTQVLLFGMTPALNILAANKIRMLDIYREIAKKLCISIPITIITLFIFIKTFNIENVYLLFFATIVNGIINILTELMKGNGAYISSQLYNGGVSTVLFIGLIVLNNFVPFGANVVELYVLSLVLSLGMNYYEWSLKYNKVTMIRICNKNRILFKNILPIYLSTVIVYLFSQMDLWVISKSFEAETIAQYGLAIRLAALLSFSTLSVRAIAASRIPLLINNKMLLQREIHNSCNFSFIVSTMTLLSLLTLGYWLIGIVFGVSYQFSWYILVVFSVGQIVNAATGPCDFLLSHTGHGISLMWITFISFSMLVLMFVVVKFFQADNVFLYCSSVSVVIAVQNLGVMYIAYKKTGILSLPSFKKECTSVER